jgi:hypothetical protein
MSENFISEMLKRKFLAPSKESLLEKIMGHEEAISRYEKKGMDENQKHILHICRDYIQSAKECMRGYPSHPHLIWNLLHRVDEHLIFLMPHDELYARAIDVRTAFDLTITEKKVREDMLGEKGKLTMAIKDIKENGQNIERAQYLIRDALQYLNENVDTNYWILSMNTLTSVCSAALLGILMLIYFLVYSQYELIPYAILGFMGAFLSNLITKENFLFVRGGPFWRYLLHNLMARPILGGFSATFIFWIEKSKWVFSINPIPADGKIVSSVQSAIISINVNQNAIAYAYIVIAVVSGFAGEKLLRNMIDKVLKKLEERAEKTKEAKAEIAKAKETT